MSKYYNAQRVKGLYDSLRHGSGQAKSKKPFRLSRAKIDLYQECPRCFYLDRRLGVARPSGFPFTLNTAVDSLLKQEFDIHRAKNKAHPLMEKYQIDAVPFRHEKLEEWRDSLHRGIRYLHQPTNLLVTGGIDDIWVDAKTGELIVVDYKATAKSKDINELDEDWQEGYKRQMEVYQWLFRQNGFKVSDRGYFVYANGQADKKAFDGKLEFEVTIIPHDGEDSWVEKTILEIYECLNASVIPKADPDCDYCAYFQSRSGKE